MPVQKFLLLIASIFLWNACANRQLTITSPTQQDELTELYRLMSGTFSSAEQAREDTLFYNINLVMYPIWENDQSAKWLYVEQAVSKYLDRPYRQRVYRLSLRPDQVFESKVYELAQAKKFIQGWKHPEIFNQINPDSLIVRPGCAVILKKEKDCYTGSTVDKDCISSLRGASYATSKVSICEAAIISWDQGWDSSDQQVWGAETKGYIFKRKKE